MAGSIRAILGFDPASYTTQNGCHNDVMGTYRVAGDTEDQIVYDGNQDGTQTLSIVVDEVSRSGGDGPGAAVAVGRRHTPFL